MCFNDSISIRKKNGHIRTSNTLPLQVHYSVSTVCVSLEL
jgi:hypothetical protein